MDRPRQIVWFERIMFATLALGVVNSWLRWPELVANSPGSETLLLTVQFFTLGLLSALYLWISRGRSKLGKWIAMSLFILGVPFTLWVELSGDISIVGWVFIVQTLAHIAAYGLLFTTDARAWFKGEWRDAGVFD